MNIYHGDCLEVLRTLPDNSVDSIVTDPPYGLSFMGKKWDYDVPSVEVWAECLRVLKPGGHLLAFSGTRTQHRMAVRIEDAGFEIRDMIAWVYGSGFPKSLDVSKAIDKANGRRFEDRYALGRHIRERREAAGLTRAEVNAWFGYSDGCEHWERQDPHGARVPSVADYTVLRERLGLSDEWQHLVERVEAEREKVGEADVPAGHAFAGETYGGDSRNVVVDITAPATEAARQWQGWGTALKPALEPITMARKPLVGTVAENVLAHGTGALNIDGARVPTDDKLGGGMENGTSKVSEGWDRPWRTDADAIERNKAATAEKIAKAEALGRWPANLIHDGSDEVLAGFPQARSAGYATPAEQRQKSASRGNCYGEYGAMAGTGYNDAGSAARFFYCAKASKKDRGDGNHHPTVKPTDLMRYLCRLVTPPGGTVLDPFMGSGSTGKAAALEGFKFIGIEREAEYLEIARARIEHVGKLTIR